MELNPRRRRKDEGRAGHGMGEDDSHAGREEQEGAAMEREVRSAPAKPSAAGSAAAPRGKGPGRLAGRRREGAGRPAGRSREGAAEEAGGRGHVERERCGREKRGGRGQGQNSLFI